MIGYHLAQNLGVTVGQEITLISPQGRDTVAGFIPRIKSFTVVAIFDVGMYEYDSAYVFMPLEAAQLYFMLPQQASQIEISVDDPDRTAAAAAAILARTGNDYRITDWKEANASFFGAIEVEGNVMFLILTLIIIVAAFNIISSQIMLVKEKGRAIAILRTMGATRGMILRIFLISGASIGVVGTIAGFALGLAFADNIEVHPAGAAEPAAHDAVPGGGLFPLAAPCHRRSPGGSDGGDHGAGALLPGHDLSRLARRASRSRRGATL